jgi:hypothetical protein
LALTGEGGLLPELVKAVYERGLQAELTDHLGYEKGDPAGRGSPNSRNGTTPKTLATEVGDVGLAVPRDRAGSFEPRGAALVLIAVVFAAVVGAGTAGWADSVADTRFQVQSQGFSLTP